MTDEERTIHYEDLPDTQVDVLIALPHYELESYLRETRAIIDNAQMIHDRLRSVRMEKIRRDCARRAKAGDQ
ncbi:hypothetical protein [Cerasicoccus frondis]|uniref:hypothetical protein n=1 Tax=Cerasicoccus frondis TaxID=490090 RepID=UPI00285279F0|nr:hypothetical protein [Cerasicoccus frondis]